MARKQIDIKRLNDSVATSGKEFNAVMKQLIQAAGQEADGLGRRTMFDMYGELVSKVPKDSARTAIGFNISDTPNEWAPPEGDYRGELGQAMEENRKRLDAIPTGRAITISNNVEYLLPLENGHSRQAPNGFLAAAIQWAKRRLEVVAEKYSRERY